MTVGESLGENRKGSCIFFSEYKSKVGFVTLGCSSVVECLLSFHKALGSVHQKIKSFGVRYISVVEHLSSMCEPWVQYQKRKDKKKSFIITYGN
jgi:hypothetical protein